MLACTLSWIVRQPSQLRPCKKKLILFERVVCGLAMPLARKCHTGQPWLVKDSDFHPLGGKDQFWSPARFGDTSEVSYNKIGDGTTPGFTSKTPKSMQVDKRARFEQWPLMRWLGTPSALNEMVPYLQAGSSLPWAWCFNYSWLLSLCQYVRVKIDM